ncbi:unnamed protein product, partial [Mesorhabditis belari]|uniref:non-specific serine/threonine protein kinase n=1 Tax=Mesorhabditis belari TaxID=2138241 RepID=A0AAF3EJI5_9BILA
MMFDLDEEIDPLETPQTDNNPFRFSPDLIEKHEKRLLAEMDFIHEQSPTTFQRSLCLNATSTLEVHISDDEESPTAELQRKLCLCASLNPEFSQEAAQRSRKQSYTSFPYHDHQITDDYKVSAEIIGIGESGKVMACYNKTTGEKYALKVLRDSPKARREVELHYLTSNHENVVTIHDIYENTFDGVKCLLMVVEFLEGGDLLSQFEGQGSVPYTEKKVGEIIRQIGAAVQFLHDMNIAHRDIKLENILCSSKGDDCVYKLGDYGFAKRPERNVLMESPCCTPYYAPPEVLGRERYDRSCDMWSLGVAMYILLCGYPPFYSMAGLALSPGMRARIAKGYYAFPHEEWDPVSDSTKNIIRNLLKTNPSERMTIHQLMFVSLVTGEPDRTTPIPIPVPGSEDERSSSDSCHDENMDETRAIPEIPKSVRFLRDGVKPPRLHSIQEEVGRALELMRMGHDSVYVKPPKLACTSLLARRRSHFSIPQVQLNY